MTNSLSRAVATLLCRAERARVRKIAGVGAFSAF